MVLLLLHRYLTIVVWYSCCGECLTSCIAVHITHGSADCSTAFLAVSLFTNTLPMLYIYEVLIEHSFVMGACAHTEKYALFCCCMLLYC